MVATGFIEIKVVGLDQCIAALQKTKTGMTGANKLILQDVTGLFVKQAKGYAHVISGEMKGSIKTSEIDPEQGRAIVEAGADYSIYENARGGDHAFWDKAVEATESGGAALVKKRMDALLRSSGLPLK